MRTVNCARARQYTRKNTAPPPPNSLRPHELAAPPLLLPTLPAWMVPDLSSYASEDCTARSRKVTNGRRKVLRLVLRRGRRRRRSLHRRLPVSTAQHARGGAAVGCYMPGATAVASKVQGSEEYTIFRNKPVFSCLKN